MRSVQRIWTSEPFDGQTHSALPRTQTDEMSSRGKRFNAASVAGPKKKGGLWAALIRFFLPILDQPRERARIMKVS
jgi:hypothetical protein